MGFFGFPVFIYTLITKNLKKKNKTKHERVFSLMKLRYHLEVLMRCTSGSLFACLSKQIIEKLPILYNDRSNTITYTEKSEKTKCKQAPFRFLLKIYFRLLLLLPYRIWLSACHISSQEKYFHNFVCFSYEHYLSFSGILLFLIFLVWQSLYSCSF